jgi:hypothetical protein
VDHPLEELLRQRVFQIAQGYDSMLKFFPLDKQARRSRRMGVAESEGAIPDLASARSFMVAQPDQLPYG